MLGFCLILLAFGSGWLLAGRVVRLGDPLEVVLVGGALTVPLTLLLSSLLLQVGISIAPAIYLAPLLLALLVAVALRRPDAPRPGPALSRLERAGLLAAMLAAWLFLNMMQVITVDDDYWLHTPVQGRLLRGIVPPTNPFFPDLVLGGHFGRDTLVAAVSLYSGRDVFGSQVLLTSFCHSLGLGILYLALRRCGTAASAVGGTFMTWLGANVAHRVGLLDFFQNNGPPTYLTLALLIYLFSELWQRPGRKLALLCGAVLGVYAQIYETHFGLVVLSVLSMLAMLSWAARKATVIALSVAAVLALTGSTAIAQLARPRQPLNDSIANQSQSVRVSFPKSPFLALRIQVGEIDPVSMGYRVGWGQQLLRIVNHPTSRVNRQYVRIWSWEVMRMHWFGVWLAPFSAWLLLRARHRAGGFLWLFGAWAFLVPGMLDFGPIHEFEWFRWEFAAGYGFAGALGVGLGTLARGRASTVTLTVLLLLQSRAGLAFLYDFCHHLTNPRPIEVLGLRFDSRDWLLRHRRQLHLDEGDLRMADWLAANPGQGRDAFVTTSGPQEPWSILFESTLMALVDLQVRGHALPGPEVPVGVPPYRFSEAYLSFLDKPGTEQARVLGFNWLLLRTTDVELVRRLMENLTLVAADTLSQDGNLRLLFQIGEGPITAPARQRDVTFRQLRAGQAPSAATQVQLSFLDVQENPMLPAATLPVPAPELAFWLAVPDGCRKLELLFLGPGGALERRLLPVEELTPPGD